MNTMDITDQKFGIRQWKQLETCSTTALVWDQGRGVLDDLKSQDSSRPYLVVFLRQLTDTLMFPGDMYNFL